MKKPDPYNQKILFPILHFEGIDFKTRFLPNRSSKFSFIDIKMCVIVISNNGMSFMSGIVQARICQNFPNFLKEIWKLFGSTTEFLGPLTYVTVTYPKLHLPTKFHPNRTKIAKVSYSVLGWL